MEYTIKWIGAHPENYEAGGVVDPVTEIKYSPIAIVDHIMEGYLKGTDSHFNNPEAQASTNFGIGKNGEIHQYVKDGVDRPFANGNIRNPSWNQLIKRPDGSYVNPNRYTVSIEHEGFTGEQFTEEMYQATLWLHKQLIAKWNIPIDNDHIIGHYRIDSVTRPNCPGKGFPWDRLFADLKAWKAGTTIDMSTQFTKTYPAGTMATVNSVSLNVRNCPDGEIVGRLANGDRVIVVGKSEDWTKIDVRLGETWVFSQYLTVDGETSPAPAPAPQPTVEKHPIIGKATATLEQMIAFVRQNNPDFDQEIAKAYLEVGEKYGIRGDIALCQSIIETSWFKFSDGTAVTQDQHNYCGLGVTSKGMKGASFATIKDGVTAQIQHLYAYASFGALPPGEVKIDPRFDLVTRGIAPNWEDLNGRWAVPGTTYGQNIVSIHKNLVAFVPPAPPAPQWTPESAGLKAVKSLHDKGIIDTPEDWTADKMLQNAPVWLVMTLLDRITNK